MYESITVQTVHKLAKARAPVEVLCEYVEVLCGYGVRGCGRMYESITVQTVHKSAKARAPVDKKRESNFEDVQLGLVISASHQPRLAYMFRQ